MKNKLLKYILIIIFIVFICSYYISNNGYYEYQLQERTIITNNKIKEFEEDIANDKNIDIKDYLDNEEVDYSNKLSNLMYDLSNNGNKLSRKIIKYLFNKLNYLVDDD